ncbi:class I SAM-dependent methyltransferase [Nocardiopsis potens]|uniref:class I SAM-dependent methyltransferase n=1 Tax=Nocardiopsis potens TaxID=1246458 RepID=UPI00036B7864|nr:class I SAM-dependent methyltransferase [Nocardiopsis potens]
MDAEEIDRGIAAFPYWHYEFDLNGRRTPVWRDGHGNRHRQRRRYLLDPLVEWAGGSLRGRRLLDLGCNSGFWSLSAVEAGCDFVLGVDGRASHVEQARFVFRARGVPPERYRFRRADVERYDPAEDGPFDVVLLLGLLYHLARPVEVLERIAALEPEAIVIDTALSRAPGAFLELHRESPEVPHNALRDSLVLVPTAQAVLELAALAGYQARMLAPDFTDHTGAEDYRTGARRAFLALRDPAGFGPPFRFEEAAGPAARWEEEQGWEGGAARSPG